MSTAATLWPFIPGVNLGESEVDTLIDYAVRIGAAEYQGPDEYPIYRHAGRNDWRFDGVCTGGQLPRQPHGAFYFQSDRRADGQSGRQSNAGHQPERTGLLYRYFGKAKLIAIKAPVFSMSKFTGVDTYLGPEMKSTGEVMGIDYILNQRWLKP